MSEPTDVDSYIADSSREAHATLKELRQIMKSTVPDAEEGISWGVPFYNYRGALAGFATYKNHVSFGLPGATLQSKDREMLEEDGYKTGKKTIQIRFDQKVPTTAIERLLKAQAKVNEANYTKD